jgi:hypothetical protein
MSRPPANRFPSASSRPETIDPGGPKHTECGDDTPDEVGEVTNFSNYNAPLNVSTPPAGD